SADRYDQIHLKTLNGRRQRNMRANRAPDPSLFTIETNHSVTGWAQGTTLLRLGGAAATPSRPPLTLSTSPVIHAAAGLHKNATAPSMSSAPPQRPSGIEPRMRSIIWASVIPRL